MGEKVKLEKPKNGVLIFLGICILFAGGFIGGGLNSIADNMHQINTETESEDSYRVVVQDGIIYKYDTIWGDVWKKEDKPNAKWEDMNIE